MDDANICPRCEGPLLEDFEESADEAVRLAFAGEPIPPHERPVRDGAHGHIATYDLDPHEK